MSRHGSFHSAADCWLKTADDVDKINVENLRSSAASIIKILIEAVLGIFYADCFCVFRAVCTISISYNLPNHKMFPFQILTLNYGICKIFILENYKFCYESKPTRLFRSNTIQWLSLYLSYFSREIFFTLTLS